MRKDGPVQRAFSFPFYIEGWKVFHFFYHEQEQNRMDTTTDRGAIRKLARVVGLPVVAGFLVLGAPGAVWADPPSWAPAHGYRAKHIPHHYYHEPVHVHEHHHHVHRLEATGARFGRRPSTSFPRLAGRGCRDGAGRGAVWWMKLYAIEAP